MNTQSTIAVGVGVFIERAGKILLGERMGSHGAGTWALPGGHLEFGESPADCAIREVLEETGLKISDIEPVAFTNDIFEKEGKHYVTLFVLAKQCDGEPCIMEPDKCKGWSWFDWNALPQPLFASLENLKQQGFVPPFGRQ